GNVTTINITEITVRRKAHRPEELDPLASGLSASKERIVCRPVSSFAIFEEEAFLTASSLVLSLLKKEAR
ncbi:MAG: hypothetical protein QWI73_05810, partial [Alphaproteobacteria bacterium]|nr:hypothetical protein [Alphaproteobacteria bacterium]